MTQKMLKAVKIFFFVFLIFTIMFMVVYTIFDKRTAIKEDKVRFIEKWTVIDPDGNTFETGRSFRDNKVYNGDFTIISKLPDHISDNDVLCFGAHIEVSVYIGGSRERTLTVIDDEDVPGGHVKTFYVTIPLYAEDSGAEIRMVRNTTYDHPEVAPETFVSSMIGVYGFLFERYGLSFCLALVLLIFSLLVIIIGLAISLRQKKNIVMLYGALGVFIVGAWLATNSYLYPFIFGHYHLDGIANYMFCLMIPFGFILYVNSIQQGRYSKILTIILACSSVNAILWTVLHFAGILSYNKALVYIDIILGLIIMIGFGILIDDIRHGNFSKYKYTVIGFFGFLFFGAIEIYILMFMTLKNDDIPMLFGLAFLLVFVVMQQVEDLKKAYEEKQKAIDLSDAKTRFLAGMSHEIRTPINSILGMNEMILKENKDDVIDEYARTVRSSGRLLLSLVNDVLDFSKIEAGKIEILEEEYSLSGVLSDIMAMLTERAESKSLTLSTQIRGEVPDGQIGDEARLKQVLTNIINNAIKYTDTGSIHVTVTGSYINDEKFGLEISVKDTGRGIKKEDIDTLFNAFYRADLMKNNSIEGTGLGLAIVKSIVDSMGGEISVESEYGKGSVFCVKIPVGVFDATPVKEDFANRKNDRKEDFHCDYTSDADILVVDDNSANLKVVKLFLKETGIQPEVCSGGAEAFELCKKNKYDLILLDHMMPSPDGMETLKLIKNDAGSMNKETDVIVLTANALAGSREMYLSAGFVDYLVKPIDSQKLLSTVKKYLPAGKVYDKEEEQVSKTVEADTEIIRNCGSFRETLKEVLPDMDYDIALSHCSDEEILKEIIGEVSGNYEERLEKLKGFLNDKDYKAYMIEVHAIKGNMATVGLMELSERAKKHEFAAKENNIDFILKDCEGFFEEFAHVCKNLGRSLK